MVGLLVVLLFSVWWGTNDLKQAEQSLTGKWNVTKIWSTGILPHPRTESSGQMGTFSFSGNQVIYSYTQLGTTYSDTSPWTLTRAMVTDGFTRKPLYTLTLKDRAYDVKFGDGRSDSEEDAKNIELTIIPAINKRRYHILMLTKQ